MSKKLFISTLIILTLLFISSLSFAAENTLLQDGVNGIRNMVGGAENVVEDAAQGLTGAVRNGTNSIENGLNTATDDMNNNNNSNNDNNNDDNYMVGTTDNNNNGNYTATRTATFMGMNGNTWTWFIIGIVGIAIIALVWAYSMQDTKREQNRH